MYTCGLLLTLRCSVYERLMMTLCIIDFIAAAGELFPAKSKILQCFYSYSNHSLVFSALRTWAICHRRLTVLIAVLLLGIGNPVVTVVSESRGVECRLHDQIVNNPSSVHLCRKRAIEDRQAGGCARSCMRSFNLYKQ